MFGKILRLLFGLLVCVQMNADISWTSPTTLSTTGIDASDPRVVIDAAGNATAVWIEGGLVQYSVAPAGMAWGAAATITGSGTGNSSPRIGVDGSGNVTAIWLDSNSAVNVSLLSGGTWTTNALPISGNGVSEPKLAVDATGNAVAVWVSGGFIQAAIKLAAGSWGVPSTIINVNVSNHPDVAIGSNGTVCAVWHTVVSGQDQIQASTQLIGGAWGAPKVVVAATFNHDYPKVAVDSNGNATVIWYRYILSNSQYTNLFVVYSLLPLNGSNWSIAQPLTQVAASRNPADLSACIGYDTNRNTIALWTTSYDGETFNVESAVRQVGGTFTTLNAIVLNNAYAFNTDLSVNNALGNALAAFMFFDGMDATIQFAESNVASAPNIINNWSTPTGISSGMNNGYPRVSQTTSGNSINAAAVWINNDGMNNLINAVTGTGTSVLPVSSVNVVQNTNDFGVFKDYYNTITWTGSSDPDATAYSIFRNGVFVGLIDTTSTTFVDHNQLQNGPVTYGVGTVDSMNRQSVIITQSFP